MPKPLKRDRPELEERFLWQLRGAGLAEPVGQFLFAPERQWRFDWAWPSIKLAVEIQGGLWVTGGHGGGARALDDYRKHNAAVRRGWTVLYITADMLNTTEALDTVEPFLSKGG